MNHPLMNAFVDEMEKIAGRPEATALSALVGPFSGLAADEGKGWQTAGGAALGGIAGGAAGAGIGYAGGKNKKPKKVKARTVMIDGKPMRIKAKTLRGSSKKDAAAVGLALGALAGRTAGAYIGHGPSKKKSKKD